MYEIELDTSRDPSRFANRDESRLNRDRIAVQLDMPDVCITAKEPQVAENLPSETTRIGNA